MKTNCRVGDAPSRSNGLRDSHGSLIITVLNAVHPFLFSESCRRQVPFFVPGSWLRRNAIVWEMSERCSRMHRFDRESNRIQTPGTLVETWSAGSSIYLSVCRISRVDDPSRSRAASRVWQFHIWSDESMRRVFLFFSFARTGTFLVLGNGQGICVISQAGMRERLSDDTICIWWSQTRLLGRTIS